jgi:hypothetical protein
MVATWYQTGVKRQAPNNINRDNGDLSHRTYRRLHCRLCSCPHLGAPLIPCTFLGKGFIVARKFEISVHRNDENIHLKLAGDFDGISAHELLDVLKKYCSQSSRIFIHTSCLRSIHPFGQNVFHTSLPLLKDQSAELVFTGDNAVQLASERPVLFDLAISTAPPSAVSETERFALSSRKAEQKAARQEEIYPINRRAFR